ncbi:hypothetical protein [Thalassobacillus hwangdonensis]|uniref:Uncharacterized protein n=1 Tax=Thalassobacillus hwangdonensis TaxID=546108 RepID=A0ABW3L074_9BACI
MVLSMKEKKGVPRQRLEQSLGEVMEEMRRLEQKISLKADEVVFTMAIAHRKEIDRLQEDIIALREEMKLLKKDQKELHMNHHFSLMREKKRA